MPPETETAVATDESKHTDQEAKPWKIPPGFDPAAALRSALKGETGAAPKQPAAKSAARAAAKPAAPDDDGIIDDLDGGLQSEEEPELEDDEELIEEEPEEQPEEQEEQEEEEEPDDEELIRDPRALLQAHNEMKGKLDKRSELLRGLALKLGVKSFAQLDSALEERLQQPGGETQQVVIQPNAQNPLINVRSDEDLTAARDWWRKEKEWLRRNPEGGTRPTADGGSEEWTAEHVAARLAQAEHILETGLAEQKELLSQQAESSRRAHDAFPFMDAKHPLFREADQFATSLVRKTPALLGEPALPELVGWAFLGKLAAAGKHGVAVKDGKVTVVTLGAARPAATAPKQPPVRRTGSPPPATRRSHEGGTAEAEAHLAQGDPREALRSLIKSGMTPKRRAS